MPGAHPAILPTALPPKGGAGRIGFWRGEGSRRAGQRALTWRTSYRDSPLLQHTTQLKVRFYELDPYFHVNHAVYMSYFETARVEALESVGLGLDAMDDKGFRIVVTNVAVAFKIPVLGGDTVDVATRVVEVRRASHHWHQEILRTGEVAVTMELRAAMTDREGRPVRVPDFFREAVSR